MENEVGQKFKGERKQEDSHGPWRFLRERNSFYMAAIYLNIIIYSKPEFNFESLKDRDHLHLRYVPLLP